MQSVIYLVDLSHYIFIISDAQIVELTRVRVQVVQERRIVMLELEIATANHVRVDVLAVRSVWRE